MNNMNNMNNMKTWERRRSLPFTRLPGLLGEMATELGASGIDSAIIESQIIAITALLTQGAADVTWPNGLSLPPGANVFLEANSGSGKSVIAKILQQPFHALLLEFF